LIGRLGRNLTRPGSIESFRRHEEVWQRDTPRLEYQNLLPIVFKRFADKFRVAAPRMECVAFGHSVGTWPVFEDAPGAFSISRSTTGSS
jgi:hypothetical protein